MSSTNFIVKFSGLRVMGYSVLLQHKSNALMYWLNNALSHVPWERALLHSNTTSSFIATPLIVEFKNFKSKS